MPTRSLLTGLVFVSLVTLINSFTAPAAEPATTFAGWTQAAPRDELRTEYVIEAGGRDGLGALVLRTDAREGLDGYWRKSFPVTGGTHYRFAASYQARGVTVPRRSVVVKLNWRDANDKQVLLDEPSEGSYQRGAVPRAETEFPATHEPAADGWTEVADVYRAPAKATQAIVELHLQWAPNAEVRWSQISLREAAAPERRVVRLATVHYMPRGGKSPAENCRQYEPLIVEAAKQKADLVVLGETLTYVGLNKSYAELAEPVPGPSTEYFAELAKQHQLYIVAGLLERSEHLVYNVAVLLGPDGQIAGKYRKVCLPRSEIEQGCAPGSDYPVFETRFGKLGMMVCYDGFFPEVARELTNRGAEVIAWPVWGCNPLLARARACENHVYLISSTYGDVAANWMISAVFDHTGETIAQASKWGSVAVVEVDLNHRTRWVSLGDYRAHLPRHRPVAVSEPTR